MNKDVADKFVEMLENIPALVSQNCDMELSHLDNDGKQVFSPLGALCELYRTETGQGEWEPVENKLAYRIAGQCGGIQFLPPMVAKWAGLVGTDPLLAGCQMRRMSNKPSLILAVQAEAQVQDHPVGICLTPLAYRIP